MIVTVIAIVRTLGVVVVVVAYVYDEVEIDMGVVVLGLAYESLVRNAKSAKGERSCFLSILIVSICLVPMAYVELF